MLKRLNQRVYWYIVSIGLMLKCVFMATAETMELMTSIILIQVYRNVREFMSRINGHGTLAV